MKILALALLLAVWGCASQNRQLATYNESKNETVYSSSKLLAGNISMSGGLASGHRVMMQAFAACDGAACKPDEVEIAFLNDSSADLNLDYRRIQIVFGGRSVEWEDHGRNTEPHYYVVPRGEFIRLPVSRGDFEAIASSPNVNIVFGLTGTTVLQVPFNRRAPLRELAETISAAES